MLPLIDGRARVDSDAPLFANIESVVPTSPVSARPTLPPSPPCPACRRGYANHLDRPRQLWAHQPANCHPCSKIQRCSRQASSPRITAAAVYAFISVSEDTSPHQTCKTSTFRSWTSIQRTAPSAPAYLAEPSIDSLSLSIYKL